MSDIAYALGTGKKLKYEAFLLSYHNRFYTMLSRVSEHTREQIRCNKELDALYDCFLDFVIDTNNIAQGLNK